MRRAHVGRGRVIGAVATVLVLVALFLDSSFLTAEELAAAGPEEFDPQQTAQELFEQVDDELLGQALPLGEVVTAVQEDLPAAARDLGATQPDDTTYVFVVRATGRVTEANDRVVSLEVEGVPAPTPVSISVGPAVSGTVLRDALGFTFADAPTQSAFQSVGDELKTLMQGELGRTPARGSTVSVEGVLSITDTGSPQSPQRPVNIQPVSLRDGR